MKILSAAFIAVLFFAAAGFSQIEKANRNAALKTATIKITLLDLPGTADEKSKWELAYELRIADEKQLFDRMTDGRLSLDADKKLGEFVARNSSTKNALSKKENREVILTIPLDAKTQEKLKNELEMLDKSAAPDKNAIEAAAERRLKTQNFIMYASILVIAGKIEDENLREDVVSFLLYRATLYFVEKKEIEIAEELAAQIKEPLRGAVAKIAVAQLLLEPKSGAKIEQPQIDFQKQRAFALLSDVQRDLKTQDASPNLAKTLFGAAAVSAKFDKAQGLSALEQVVQTINKLDEFNLKDAAAPKLGIDAYSTSSATVATPRIGFGFAGALASLVETDFEQIASIVERLSAKETRGVGRIEAAKAFFQKNKSLTAKLNH